MRIDARRETFQGCLPSNDPMLGHCMRQKKGAEDRNRETRKERRETGEGRQEKVEGRWETRDETWESEERKYEI